ncbi:MAG: excinuclease ABC subunit UvrC, partial [Deltaproteobacteria bacterium]|nr:excinuclease ABC subunit UvrC [Deltaproteobacteria bacterium]
MELEQLKQKAAAMPDAPGVYLMKDRGGRVIYVGKAKSLPKRVGSYFQRGAVGIRVGIMVSHVADFDFMVTTTEKEALILENILIKKHKPKYNVVLRDDKTYPSLRLNVQEEFPRLEIIRRIHKDGAVYFGPFSSVTAMRQTVALIRRLFPMRQCRRPDVKDTKRACLNYQLGRCLGPCQDHVTAEEYRAMVDQVVLFFQGRNRILTDDLKRRMKEAAEKFEFEQAARYRDRLAAVERTLEKQQVVSPDMKNQDVIGLAMDRGQVLAVILYVRAGAVLGNRIFPLTMVAEPGDIVESLLGQYYGRDNLVPEEVLVPLPLENRALIQEWLKEKRGRPVALLHPVRGPRRKLLDMAADNATTALSERLRAVDLGVDALTELKLKLHLPYFPRRIECFDMSTLRGEAAVGAMVVLEEGKWIKSDYRRFRIKTASGQDDYAMMAEVLNRRLVKEDLPKPDLLLLDGGRGQLGVAMAVVNDLGIVAPPPLAGLAKGRDGEPDHVWLPGRKNPVDFRAD